MCAWLAGDSTKQLAVLVAVMAALSYGSPATAGTDSYGDEQKDGLAPSGQRLGHDPAGGNDAQLAFPRWDGPPVRDALEGVLPMSILPGRDREPVVMDVSGGVLRTGDCCPLGDFTNPFLLRNFTVFNVISVSAQATLADYSIEMDFTSPGPVLITYVIYRRNCAGTWNVLATRVVAHQGVGRRFYSSGSFNLVLDPVRDCSGSPTTEFYALGVGWGNTFIDVARDSDVYPQTYCMGAIFGSKSFSSPPPLADPLSMGSLVQSGVWSMEVCFVPPPGACCLPDDSCTMVADATACELLGGTFSAADVQCDDVTCPLPEGACCIPPTICAFTNEYACLDDLGGITWERDRICEPFNPCGPPVGACCHVDGSCEDEVTQTACEAAQGVYRGDYSQCNDPTITCTPRGACCLTGPGCLVRTSDQCTGLGGDYVGDGTHCQSLPEFPLDPCNQDRGACCTYDGHCTDDMTEFECEFSFPNETGGIWQGQGIDCDTAACPVLGGCCSQTGSCTDTSSNGCTGAGQTWNQGEPCEFDPCSATVGACCLFGECEIRNRFDCRADGGEFQDVGTSAYEACVVAEACTNSFVGACCMIDTNGDPTCEVLSLDDCNTSGGTFTDYGVACSGIVCATATCCDELDVCMDMSRPDCIAQGDEPGLPGSFCPGPTGVNPCVPSGACCFSDGRCEIRNPGMDPGQCGGEGGTYQGDDVECTAGLCPVDGACCVEFAVTLCFEETDHECDARPQQTTFAPGGTCIPGACDEGACCALDGSCSFVTRMQCALDPDALFDDSVSECGPDNEPCEPRGACCIDMGCELRTEHDCTTNGGLYQGNGVPCDEDACDFRACCVPGGGCEDRLLINCQGTDFVWGEPGQLCAGGDLCTPGACCIDFGSGSFTCFDDVHQLGCQTFADSMFAGPGSSCADDPCELPEPGVCCEVDGTCSVIGRPACESLPGALFVDTVTECGPDNEPCEPRGACCIGGGCELRTGPDCTTGGGVYAGDAVLCDGEVCAPRACCLGGGICADLVPQECASSNGVIGEIGQLCAEGELCTNGACCVDVGTSALACTDGLMIECQIAGGTFAGPGTACIDDPCVRGACCVLDGTCDDAGGAGVSETDCDMIAGALFLPGGTCSPNPCCASSASCPEADVNCDGVSDGFDIAIIRVGTNWFMSTGDAAEPRADVNRDGTIDGFDIARVRSGTCWLQ